MRYATASSMALAAICISEAVAGPVHAHLHQHAHQKAKKDTVDWAALDWDNMGVDWASAYAAGQKGKATSTAAAVAATTAAVVKASTTAAPAATTTKASPGAVVSTIVDDITDLFEGVVGCSNSRTKFGSATAASGSTGDNYYGNIGSPYGANIIKVSSASGYDFTNTFHNTQKKSITINVWQKVGPDLRVLSGSALAPKNTTLTFVLAPGAKQTIAIQGNTQIAWAEATSAIATSGAFATTWGELNCVSTGSGYDVSAIMNPKGSNYAMTITSVEAPGCTSSMSENYWLTDTQPIGDSNGSCFIAQSTATITTVMGGTV